MKEMKKELKRMKADVSEMKDTVIEINCLLDELGFPEPTRKPKPAFSVIKGGLS